MSAPVRDFWSLHGVLCRVELRRQVVGPARRGLGGRRGLGVSWRGLGTDACGRGKSGKGGYWGTAVPSCR